MKHDIHSLLNILVNTGIVCIVICGCGCLYLRQSIILQNRQPRNLIPIIYPNIIINGQIYYPQQDHQHRQNNILNI